MRHEDRPRTIPETVHAALFPVYGLSGHPLDLSLSSHGLGISHLGNLIHVSLLFTSPRYSNSYPYSHYFPKSGNFQIISVDAAAQHPEKEHMVFELADPSNGQFFDNKIGVFGQHHFSEEEQKQAGGPIVWKKTLRLANAIFSGKILHWRRPLRASAFLLKSAETILIGDAYGPSDEELMQLLEGLQVINHQDDLLGQYQYAFENPDL
jgi:hypothetical protein